jgi:hypothetical protein
MCSPSSSTTGPLAGSPNSRLGAGLLRIDRRQQTTPARQAVQIVATAHRLRLARPPLKTAPSESLARAPSRRPQTTASAHTSCFAPFTKEISAISLSMMDQDNQSRPEMRSRCRGWNSPIIRCRRQRRAPQPPGGRRSCGTALRDHGLFAGGKGIRTCMGLFLSSVVFGL